MNKYNLVIVYSPDETHVLMCIRAKEPYQGLLNFAGGKLENKETALDGAYRELFEETGISERDITLTHVMDFTYHLSGFEMQVFAGRLTHDIPLKEEANKLVWVSVTEDFTDTSRFAGEGNIAHMLLRLEKFKNRLFG